MYYQTYNYLQNTWDAQEIVPGIFLGSVYAANDLPQLKRNNIDCVLDLSNGSIKEHPDIQYCSFGNIDDDPRQPMTHLFPTALGYMTYCQRNNKRLLVNCQMGISRSTTVVIAYLIHYHQMTVTQAVRYIKEKRRKIQPNPGFLMELEKFMNSDHHHLQDQIDDEANNFAYGRPVEHYQPIVR